MGLTLLFVPHVISSRIIPLLLSTPLDFSFMSHSFFHFPFSSFFFLSTLSIFGLVHTALGIRRSTQILKWIPADLTPPKWLSVFIGVTSLGLLGGVAQFGISYYPLDRFPEWDVFQQVLFLQTTLSSAKNSLEALGPSEK